MAVNCLLLFSAILYFLTFAACLCVISALALAKSKLEGKCFLFADSEQFPPQPGYDGPCDFTLYVPIAAAGYAFCMGIYHAYALCVAFKETHVGRTMWVMPWMLVNSLMGIVMLCSSAIFSIGFSLTCSKFAQRPESKVLHCDYIFDYGKGTGYRLYNVTQVSTWLCVILWIADFALTVVRFVRNRRARTSDDFHTSSDRNPIALSTPTA